MDEPTLADIRRIVAAASKRQAPVFISIRGKGIIALLPPCYRPEIVYGPDRPPEAVG